jgi:UDP-N-acetylglucosamine 2-epimerase (non-hydrolysing)
MIDTMLNELPHAIASGVLQELGLVRGGYVYVTLHRPCNVDHPQTLCGIIRALDDISRYLPVVFAVHPRTRCRLEQAKITLPGSQGLRVIGPQAYRRNLSLLHGAKAVLTDSGGIQEETSVLSVPCLTLRDATERPVTIEFGSSELVGTDPDRILSAWSRVVDGHWKKAIPIPLWDGGAAERIVTHLRENWAPVVDPEPSYTEQDQRALVHV